MCKSAGKREQFVLRCLAVAPPQPYSPKGCPVDCQPLPQALMMVVVVWVVLVLVLALAPVGVLLALLLALNLEVLVVWYWGGCRWWCQ